MRELPRYKNPISLIPGGCIQFLDFEIELSGIGKIRRHFKEEKRPQAEAEGRHSNILRCLELDDGAFVDMVTKAPCDYDYEVDALKSLDIWYGQWLPLPFLRIRGQKWGDGEERFEYGPSNWARAMLTPSDVNPDNLRLVIVFDMGIEEPPEDGEEYFALSPKDVSAHATFRLAGHVRDNAWFLNSTWIDEWLFHIWSLWLEKFKKKNQDSEFSLEYLANYLTLLDVLKMMTKDITVQVINPERDNPVDVDLVLDIGNSRTTGLLVETLPQKITNLNDSYLLQLRDLNNPQHIYTDPFESRVEFVEASFGNDALSRRSGRRSPAFTWPSLVRIGPEAARFSTFAVCAEGTTGMSSPKRYLWDERLWQQSWRVNTGGGHEPMVTRGLLAKKVNKEGTPLICFEDQAFKRNPNLRLQEKEIAFESLYTRSSLMMFMLVEIILQALLTINSPGQRNRQDLPNVPRRLRQVIFTVPPGMPIAEQRIYRRWVNWAVRLLWDAMGWQDYYLEAKVQQKTSNLDYRFSPVVRCEWDEAICTQLVYLYNELTRKLQGDAHHLFELIGKVRDKKCPSIRIATIDIGGGTTDLSISTFILESDKSSGARIRPVQEFRDGFNIAGDDIVREIVNSYVLPAISKAAANKGYANANSLLSDLFGRDVMDNSQESRNLRAQFTRQIATPIALSLLSIYEQSDLISGTGTLTYTFKDFFRLSADALKENKKKKAALPDESEKDKQKSEEATPDNFQSTFEIETIKHPYPGEAVINYVEAAVNKRLPGSEFKLMDVEIRLAPRQMDKSLRQVMSNILTDLSEVIKAYDTDIVLLTGRPSRWHGIISTIYATLPVPPSRILPMSRFKVGSWYPFSDSMGNITDPKTTVVVGAILCALAEGHLEGFSFDTSALAARSTARFIGEMDIVGQLKKEKVWFAVNVDSCKEQDLTATVQFNGPTHVGFRQLDIERWPTTRFYLIDFVSEDARRKASARLPYSLNLHFLVSELEENISSTENANLRDEGELYIADIQDKNGDSINKREIEVRLQTLPLDEGYWLDTGIIYYST